RAELPFGEPLGRVAVAEVLGVGQRIHLRILAADDVSILVVEPRWQDPQRSDAREAPHPRQPLRAALEGAECARGSCVHLADEGELPRAARVAGKVTGG